DLMSSPVVPKRSYAICTNPRSGSWLLAEGLQSTRIAGRPREWFHPDSEGERSGKWGLAHPKQAGYADYMNRVIQEATTRNGVFGVKLHWYQMDLLRGKVASIAGLSAVPLHEALPRIW